MWLLPPCPINFNLNRAGGGDPSAQAEDSAGESAGRPAGTGGDAACPDDRRALLPANGASSGICALRLWRWTDGGWPQTRCLMPSLTFYPPSPSLLKKIKVSDSNTRKN